MTDDRLARWADLLCDYCLEIRPGEVILIAGDLDGQALLEACFRAVVDRGAYPLTRVALPGLHEYFVEHASEDMRVHMPSLLLREAREVDGRIRIAADRDVTSMSRVDPKRQAEAAAALKPVRHEAMKRKWVLTQFPTHAYAAEAGMSLEEYEAFVERALFLDQPDPAESWRGLGRRQAALVDFMGGVETLRFEGPGTDLTLSVAGRTWINSDGKRNMPSGEIFTGPIEDSAQGVLTCGFPVCRGGRRISGIRLEFERGEVVRASADSEEAYLRSMIDLDDGARRLGELGIGLNFGVDRFTGAILFDEKIGGTVHFALGQSYPETGGQNSSALHWDLIADLRTEGRVFADGRLVMESGRWNVD